MVDTRKSNFGLWLSIVVMVSDVVHWNTLLQNAKDVITKCDCYCILLQNTSGFLFQNATVLFKEPTVITKCDNVFTKCNIYYKMRLLLQNELVQR